jgi:hypothetical protein
MQLTSYRIQQVEDACRKNAKGPWVDLIHTYLTAAEYEEIMAHWKTLSGNSCFVSAMFDLKLQLKRKGQ